MVTMWLSGPKWSHANMVLIKYYIPEQLRVRDMYIFVRGQYGTVYREIVNHGTGNHMTIKARMVPLVMILSYKIAVPHSNVLRICRSLSQAMMALCIERC